MPYIPVKLETAEGLIEFDFLVDTGADLTTLPHYMASKMNIDLNKAKKSVAEGIGGFKVDTWLTRIDLHFGKTVVNVRASFTNENSTPFLLGRIDILDNLYSWKFDSKKKRIVFEEV